MPAPRDDLSGRHVEELIDAGSEIAGSVAGAALGLVVAGPPGALGGAAAGPVLVRGFRRIGDEISLRVLGPRQKARVGGAIAYALIRIEERLATGDQLRQDGFFESAGGQRMPADEILEGVLLQAANTWEERKVRLLGNLYANLAFDETAEPGLANYLVTLVQGLTFRQLGILWSFADLPNLPELTNRQLSYSSELIASELHGLGTTGLLGIGQDDGRVANFNAVYGGGTFSNTPMGRIQPTPLGRRVVDLLGLENEMDRREFLPDLIRVPE